MSSIWLIPLIAAIFGAYVRGQIDGHDKLMNPATLTWLESLAGAPSVVQGLMAEGEITRRLGEVHDRFDALLCPTMAIPAYRAGVDYCTEPVLLDGVEYDGMREICLSEVFNPAGRCPVITLPAGRDASELPSSTSWGREPSITVADTLGTLIPPTTTLSSVTRQTGIVAAAVFAKLLLPRR